MDRSSLRVLVVEEGKTPAGDMLGNRPAAAPGGDQPSLAGIADQPATKPFER